MIIAIAFCRFYHRTLSSLSRAQGRTIVRASSTASTGRRFISRRGLLHGLVVSGALCNGVKGTGE